MNATSLAYLLLAGLAIAVIGVAVVDLLSGLADSISVALGGETL